MSIQTLVDQQVIDRLGVVLDDLQELIKVLNEDKHALQTAVGTLSAENSRLKNTITKVYMLSLRGTLPDDSILLDIKALIEDP